MPALGIDGLQLATGASTVSFGLQVVEVQLLPPLATGSGVQDATAVGPVFTTGQVVVVQLLPALAGLEAQLPVGTLSALFAVQVVVV